MFTANHAVGYITHRAIVRTSNASTGICQVEIPELTGAGILTTVSNIGLSIIAGLYNVPAIGSTVFVASNRVSDRVFFVSEPYNGSSTSSLAASIGVLNTASTNAAASIGVLNTASTNAAASIAVLNTASTNAAASISTLSASVGVLNSQISNPNLLHNPQMQVAQRGTGTVVSTTSKTWTVDRWGNVNNNVGTQQLQTGAAATYSALIPSGRPRPFSYWLVVQTVTDASLAAGDYSHIGQSLESQDCSSLKWGTPDALPLTVSFDVYCSISATFVLEAKNQTTGGFSCSATYTTTANQYKTVSITFPACTGGAVFANDSSLGLGLQWWTSAGTDYQTGSLNTSWTSPSATPNNRATGQNNTFANTSSGIFGITNVKAEVGSSATTFTTRPYPEELRICQRYFCKTFPQATAPAQNAGVAGAAMSQGSGDTAGYGSQLWWRFPVTMRATPVITTYNPSAADANGRNVALGTNVVASINTGFSSDSGCEVTLSTASGGAGHQLAIHMTATAEI